MRIAIILFGNSKDKKGAFNAAHNRIKYLSNYKDLKIDVYLIQEYENRLIRTLRKSKKRIKEDSFIYDGVNYHNIWWDFSLLNYLINIKLKKFSPFYLKKIKKDLFLFKNYDHISAHLPIPGIFALLIKKKYKIPFSITWHGSEIHTISKLNPSILKWIQLIMQEAKNNFFVSQNLLNQSEIISKTSNKIVLYNGVDTNNFYRKPLDEIKYLRNKLRIVSKFNIAFIGNIVSVKNVELLPAIFLEIHNNISDVVLHIVGDGNLKNKIKKEFTEISLPVRFYGNQSPEIIPSLINCMDLIILPSKNEGLPLIALESLACETPIIGSRVGGIPEAIGIENTIPLDGDFVKNFSKLAIKILKGYPLQKLSKIFSWNITSEKEFNAYIKINDQK